MNGRGQTVRGHWHGWWYPPVEKARGRKRARREGKEEVSMETQDEMVKDVCQAKDCERPVTRPKDAKHWFCSIECACYAKKFNVGTGWKDEDPQGPPPELD